MIKIMKRTVSENHKIWHNALYNALWADRVTPKESIGYSPLFLVYRREAIFLLTSFSPHFSYLINFRRKNVPL